MMLRPSPPPVRLQRTEELRKVDDREYRKRALSVAVCECCCVNYRTTDEIRRRAVALLENIAVDDLDDARQGAALPFSLARPEAYRDEGGRSGEGIRGG
jgi:hypothetical protein